jgi:hypothetical protein
MWEKPGFPAYSRVSREACQTAGMAGWGGRIQTLRWRIGNQPLSPVQEELQNSISLKFISLSKSSNFENRTESTKSRAPERNEPFGEECADAAD